MVEFLAQFIFSFVDYSMTTTLFARLRNSKLFSGQLVQLLIRSTKSSPIAGLVTVRRRSGS
tara:strand:- start:328 stop:510 length:183 start_codon:yes stop_codon:yes gene_type:complete